MIILYFILFLIFGLLFAFAGFWFTLTLLIILLIGFFIIRLLFKKVVTY